MLAVVLVFVCVCVCNVYIRYACAYVCVWIYVIDVLAYILCQFCAYRQLQYWQFYTILGILTFSLLFSFFCVEFDLYM